MEPGHLPLLLLLPPLLAASALCSSSETALFTLSHGDRVRLAHLSPRSAAIVSRLLEHPRSLLVTILLANNVINVMYLVTSSVLAARAYAGVAVAISAGSLLALILLGEIVPKLFARKVRVDYCRILARPMMMVHQALTPLRIILDRGIIAPLARLFRPAGRQQARRVSSEELSALLEISAGRGEIDAEEQRLLAEVVELHAIRVREAMIPRQEVPWIDHTAKAEELLAVIQRCGRMHIPVFRGSLDGEPLGIVDARRYLAARELAASPARAGTPPHPPQLTEFLSPVLFIPELARLDQCLEQFRRRRAHEALCVDEFGAIAGAIRIEDILRELVTHPVDGEAAPTADGRDFRVEEIGPGRWMVPGRLGLRALTEFLASPDALADYQRVSTVAGAIIVTLGRLPVEGDSVTVGNVRLEVAGMRGRSVERVLVSLAGERAAPEGGAVAKGGGAA